MLPYDIYFVKKMYIKNIIKSNFISMGSEIILGMSIIYVHGIFLKKPMI